MKARALKIRDDFSLSKCDPNEHGDWNERRAEKRLSALQKEMRDLQTKLFASQSKALLVILQGIDASGKDGTIKAVMSGINPLGCQVTAFKEPAGAETKHDYLWRIHNALPPKGFIGIFNRSQYEEILVPAVHESIDRSAIEKRYRQINQFERMLTEEGTTVIKFFLHISKKEQLQRLEMRLADPQKNWKYSKNDLVERKHWAAYMKEYERILQQCSTKWARWRLVPADHKWYRNLVVAEEIVRVLQSMNLKYPVIDK